MHDTNKDLKIEYSGEVDETLRKKVKRLKTFKVLETPLEFNYKKELTYCKVSLFSDRKVKHGGKIITPNSK